MKRLRVVADVNPRVSGLGKADAGRVISFVPLESVWADDRFDPSRTMEFGGDTQSYNPVAEGDLLVPKVSPTFAQGRVAIAKGLVGGRALATSEVFVVRAHDRAAAPFLKYRLLARDFLSAGQAAWYGVAGLKRISMDFLLDVRINDEAWRNRTAIADFLEHECARIDSLRTSLGEMDGSVQTAAREQLRSLVLEARWPLAPVKYYARTGTGHTPSRGHAEYWRPEDCIVPWFTLADVNQIRDGRRWEVFETIEKISEIGIAHSSAEKHPPATVILSRTASVGFSAVMGREMAVSQDFMTWTCGPDLDPYYLLVAMRAMQPELRRLMYGSTHKTIYMPDLHALRIPLPPIERQREIVAGARSRMSPLWPLCDELSGMVVGLSEYREALITEAVTGKLHVSGLGDSAMAESLAAVREGEPPEVLAR